MRILREPAKGKGAGSAEEGGRKGILGRSRPGKRREPGWNPGGAGIQAPRRGIEEKKPPLAQSRSRGEPMRKHQRPIYGIVPLCLAALLLPGGSTRAGPAANGPSSTPQVKASTLSLKGLRGRVTVHYDERGIPYIEAQNQDDLYFAQGFVVARDRLWQMDLLRRTARGELSEIFGRPALDEDKRRRRFGFAALA